MKASSFGRAAAVLSVASLALVACGGDNGDAEETDTTDESVETEENGTESSGEESEGEASGDLDLSGLSGSLVGSGASSHQVAMEEWVFEFGDLTDGANVDYTAVGSGTGRAEFLNGQSAFAGSDAAMSEDEYEESIGRCGPDGAFHIPSFIAPIGVAVNLEGVDSINLDADTLGDIFAGEITSWDDDAIAALNEDADLPDTSITVVHRSDSSGTTENFTEYLQAASANWDWEADGEWPSEISAESGDGTSGVVQAVQSVDGGITYADAGQIPSELTVAAIEVGGEFTEVSPEAAAQAVSASTPLEGFASNDMGFEIARDTEEVGAYPIVQIAYTIWCNEYEDAAQAELAEGFASYIVSDEAQQLAADEAGSAPLSEELRDQALDAIGQISG